MKLALVKGTTSKIVHVFILDSSATDGSGLTGLTYNSSGLAAYYIRPGDSSPTAITLATAAVGTWTSGGFVEVDATNMPGVYEIGLPDACLASGADQVVIMLQGATDMAPVVLEIELTDFDLHTATVTVGTNNDKTGYDLSADQSGVTVGEVNTVNDKTGYAVDTVNDKTGYSLAADQSGVTIGTVNSMGDKTGYSVDTVNDKTGYSISGTKTTLDDLNDIAATDVLTAVGEGSLSLEAMLRIILAANAGISSGGRTTTQKFRDVADTKDRIVATVDTNGNRLAVTLDGS